LQIKEVAEGNLGVGAKYHSLLSAVILLFNGIPQKTVAAITNYTERQVRNIRAQYELSNGDFPREGKKRARKKKIKKTNIRANPLLRFQLHDLTQ